MSEIIGYYDIPDELVGTNYKEILKWAREKMYGQEPNLSQNDLKEIRDGRISKVFLEPKIPGTFLPDGTFIKALSYTPTIGDDFTDAEKEWEKEERINQWIQEENQRFNKKKRKGNLDYWEHGKRIVEFSNEMDEPTHVIARRLGEFGAEDDYGWLSHSLHVDFYLWKPNIESEDPILGFKWKTISDILMFGRTSNELKDILLFDLQAEPFNQLKTKEIYLLLNGNLSKYGYSVEDQVRIENIRKKYHQLQGLTIDEKNRITKIIQHKQ